jgi:hypothetical protein
VTGSVVVTCVRELSTGPAGNCQRTQSGAGWEATVIVCASSSARCAVSAQEAEGSSILIDKHCNYRLQQPQHDLCTEQGGNVEKFT